MIGALDGVKPTSANRFYGLIEPPHQQGCAEGCAEY